MIEEHDWMIYNSQSNVNSRQDNDEVGGWLYLCMDDSNFPYVGGHKSIYKHKIHKT